MLRAPSAVVNNTRNPLFFSVSLPSNSFSSSILRFSPARNGYGNGGLFVSALKGDDTQPQPGVDFFSVEEVHDVQRTAPQASLGGACEDEINLLINVSYVYHSMFAYFHRENVALKGFAKFFEESSEEKRDVAEKLMEFQNKRGGGMKLESIIKPLSEYDHDLKGNPGMNMHFHTLSMLTSKATVDLHMMALRNNDIELINSYDKEISRRLNQIERVECYLEGAALPAMELALSLERITNEKLLHLHKVGKENKDLQLTEFIKTEFLDKQVKLIEKISEYVAELRRVGKGQEA